MTFREIIALWPSPDALAAELGAKPETVRKWRQRDSIPAEYWFGIIHAAKRLGRNITTDDMAAAIKRQPSSDQRASA